MAQLEYALRFAQLPTDITKKIGFMARLMTFKAACSIQAKWRGHWVRAMVYKVYFHRNTDWQNWTEPRTIPYTETMLFKPWLAMDRIRQYDDQEWNEQIHTGHFTWVGAPVKGPMTLHLQPHGTFYKDAYLDAVKKFTGQKIHPLLDQMLLEKGYVMGNYQWPGSEYYDIFLRAFFKIVKRVWAAWRMVNRKRVTTVNQIVYPLTIYRKHWEGIVPEHDQLWLRFSLDRFIHKLSFDGMTATEIQRIARGFLTRKWLFFVRGFGATCNGPLPGGPPLSYPICDPWCDDWLEELESQHGWREYSPTGEDDKENRPVVFCSFCHRRHLVTSSICLDCGRVVQTGFKAEW